ncbi:MAG TPA: protein-S-isoprenylcysteine O-methyltransferase [Terriglobia bacterium]|nr:protein-S-isoprenylcysteine O-methyltransferase [Terriglobia bacterium]
MIKANSENLFRISFGILWILYLGIRIYFQGKISSKRNLVRTNEKQESLFFRIFAAAYLLLPIYCLTSWIDFAHFPIPAWLRWAGGIITCAGIALFSWAHYVLGRNWTAVLALSEEHELITHGPYRYVRHPMYSAFFTIGIGFLFLSANWLTGLIYLGPLILMYEVRISREEEMMIGRFGEAYRQYMKKTGRILPRLRN